MTREKFIAELKEWEGTPYHVHAATKRVGCDCVGLLVGALRRCDANFQLSKDDAVLMNTYAEGFTAGVLSAWLNRNFDRIPKREAREGDVLAFNIGGRLQHLAILLDRNTIIHAQEYRKRVTVNQYAEGWRERAVGAYAVRGIN